MANSQVLFIAAWIFLFQFAEGIEVTLYEHGNYEGRSSHMVTDRCMNVDGAFNDMISSVKVKDDECVILWRHACCQGNSTEVKGGNGATVPFNNDHVSAISPCGDYRPGFPDTIKETWAGHNETMTKKIQGQDPPVAIYFNDDMVMSDDDMQNNFDLIQKIWNHTKNTYGYFGPEDGPLAVFFHANSKYASVTPQNYFDGASSCRNLIDLPAGDNKLWNGTLKEQKLDVVLHTISLIVEVAGKRHHGAPTIGFWKGNKWPEVYEYDVYNSLGLAEEKDRLYKRLITVKSDFPKEDTYWFRDWFHPIYEKHGGAATLSKYFELLAEHWPKWHTDFQYSPRQVNLGEFVHFFSGAAGQDLKEQAKIAFKFDDKAEEELKKAKEEFKINY